MYPTLTAFYTCTFLHMGGCLLLMVISLSPVRETKQVKIYPAEQRPKMPDASKRASTGLVGCFGGGPAEGGDPGEVTAAPTSAEAQDSLEDSRETLLPPALVGLRNIGVPRFLHALSAQESFAKCTSECISLCQVVWHTTCISMKSSRPCATEN